jgi:hypothetical protein
MDGGEEYTLVDGVNGQVSAMTGPTVNFDYSHQLYYDYNHMNHSLFINNGMKN